MTRRTNGKNSVSSATGRYRKTEKPNCRCKFSPTVSVLVFMHSSIWSNPHRVDSSLSGCPEWVGNRILTFAPVYWIGREPVMRMSTSLLALCCQPGPDAT
jgi:hypothetical protein